MIEHLFHTTSNFVHHFKSICDGIQTEVTVRKRSMVKIGDFLSRVTLKFDGWPWKTIGHLFYAGLGFFRPKSVSSGQMEKLDKTCLVQFLPSKTVQNPTKTGRNNGQFGQNDHFTQLVNYISAGKGLSTNLLLMLLKYPIAQTMGHLILPKCLHQIKCTMYRFNSFFTRDAILHQA